MMTILLSFNISYFHVATTFCTIYTAAMFGLPRRGPWGSTTDLDEAVFLAYLLNFERASQSPAAGGSQAGGDCKGVTTCIWTKKELKDGLWADPVNGVLFLRLAFHKLHMLRVQVQVRQAISSSSSSSNPCTLTNRAQFPVSFPGLMRHALLDKSKSY